MCCFKIGLVLLRCHTTLYLCTLTPWILLVLSVWNQGGIIQLIAVWSIAPITWSPAKQDCYGYRAFSQVCVTDKKRSEGSSSDALWEIWTANIDVFWKQWGIKTILNYTLSSPPSGEWLGWFILVWDFRFILTFIKQSKSDQFSRCDQPHLPRFTNDTFHSTQDHIGRSEWIRFFSSRGRVRVDESRLQCSEVLILQFRPIKFKTVIITIRQNWSCKAETPSHTVSWIVRS